MSALFRIIVFAGIFVLVGRSATAQQPTASTKAPVAVELARLKHHPNINMAIKSDGSRVYVYYTDCAYMFDADGKKLGAAPGNLDRDCRGVDVDGGFVYRAYDIPNSGGGGRHLTKIDLATGDEIMLVKRDALAAFEDRYAKNPNYVKLPKPIYRAPDGKSYVLSIDDRGDYLVDENFKKLAVLGESRYTEFLIPWPVKALPVFTPDSRTVWVKTSLAGNKYIYVPYDTATGKAGEPIATESDAYIVSSNPDGSWLYGVFEKSYPDKGTIVWRLNVKSGKYDHPFAAYDSNSKTPLTALAFASGADIMALAERAGRIRVLNSTTGVELALIEIDAKDYVGKLALTSDGKTLFAHIGPRSGEKSSVLLKYTLK